MRICVWFVVLLAGLALTACHRAVTYSATAEIRVVPVELVDLNLPYDPHELTPRQKQDALQAIESPDVLAPVITNLQLDRIWGQRLNNGGALPMPEAIRYFTSKLRVENKRGTAIFTITATADVPEEAVDMANAVVSQYKSILDRAEENLSQPKIDALKVQITQQEKIVDEEEAKFAKFPQQAGLESQMLDDLNALDVLKSKLKQAEVEMNIQESPVIIISPATWPPE